ncbi:conserved protein of unknown function [Pseudomonas marincola]|uniref:Uncharacterized protein n=1 Tax=Pseudomonas marincola TaxID=437900 RepID=A0A653E1V6_9PSED|nr:conserved protein of unknown function [Pseudomonas marincola]
MRYVLGVCRKMEPQRGFRHCDIATGALRLWISRNPQNNHLTAQYRQAAMTEAAARIPSSAGEVFGLAYSHRPVIDSGVLRINAVRIGCRRMEPPTGFPSLRCCDWRGVALDFVQPTK